MTGIRSILLGALLVVGLISAEWATAGFVVPGDYDGDGNAGGTSEAINDAISLLNSIFNGTGNLPDCSDRADAITFGDYNGDMSVDMSDAIALLRKEILGEGDDHNSGTACIDITTCPDICPP